MNEIQLFGELGPDQVDSLSEKLGWLLEQPRPQLELDLCNVTSLHLGIVNVLIGARNEAQARLGDLRVVVGSGSETHYTLARVGIVATLRP